MVKILASCVSARAVARLSFLDTSPSVSRSLAILLVFALLISIASFASFAQATKNLRFAAIGDYGDNSSNINGSENVEMRAVANLIDDKNVKLIITTGDNSYTSTAIDTNIGKYYADYIGSYSGGYGDGATSNAFFPSAGNHDYSDGGGISTYLSYFTLPGIGISTSGTSGTETYYDFVQGPVHFFVIDPNNGTGVGSIQRNWLQAQHAASTSTWKIVYDHHPPFSSALHMSTPDMQWPFEERGVTAVLSGHDHVYERIIRDDNSDGTDIPYFITGLGGSSRYPFITPVSGIKVRYNSDFGAMIVDASDARITFTFWSVAGGVGGTLIDTYTIVASTDDGCYVLNASTGKTVVFCL
ncbi:MAG: alkaline phosphatase [Proteobacteria bacterium]|nr:alkaline phosphatase [Pseudomonadota bacterium]